jgi:hypothetical protein
MQQLHTALTIWSGVTFVRHVAILATALAVGLFAFGLYAQDKPDFSGKWTLIESTQPQESGGGRGGFGGGSRGGFGDFVGGIFGGRGGAGGRKGGQEGGRGGSAPAQNLVIKQDAETLTIQGTTDRGTQTNTYKLDGLESVNSTQRGQLKSKASWDGDKLVVTSTGTASMMGKSVAIELREVFSLDRDGAMVIETTRSAGARRADIKAVYRKAR